MHMEFKYAFWQFARILAALYNFNNARLMFLFNNLTNIRAKNINI